MRGGSFAGDAGERVLPEKQTFDAERLFGCETVFFRTPSCMSFPALARFARQKAALLRNSKACKVGRWSCVDSKFLFFSSVSR